MANYQRLNEPLVNPDYSQQQPPPQQYAAAYPPQLQQPPHPYPQQQPHYPHQHQPQPGYPPQLAPQYPPQQPGIVGQIGTPGHLAHGRWSDGIFDCFDSGMICVLALFIPFLRWSTTVSRIRYLSFPTALAISAPLYIVYTVLYVYLNVSYPGTYGTDSVDTFPAIYFVLLSVMIACHLIFVVVGAYYRNQLRRDYGVSGNMVEDCCWHLCCQCCAIAQEARHVDRDCGIAL